MPALNTLEAITLTLGDEYNDVGGALYTRLASNFTGRTLLQSGAGLQNASSSDTGVTVTISSGSFSTSASGAIFRVLSLGTTVQEAVVASRDSATQLTLAGTGIGENFTNVSWELVTPGSTVATVETTLGFPPTGMFAMDGRIYRYSGRTPFTFSGIEGLNEDAEFVSGALQDHRAGTELRDLGRNFSYIDQLRREFFVNYAESDALDAVGRNVGIRRPPSQPDSIFREIIKAIAYTRRGTYDSIEQLLTALFGPDDFTIFEDLTGGRPDVLNNTCTVFVRGGNNDPTRYAGKTFIDGAELVRLTTTITGALPEAVLDIRDVRLAPDPRRGGPRLIVEEGTGTISGSQSSFAGAGEVSSVTLDGGSSFSSAIQPGDTLIITSGIRRGERATIRGAGGTSTLALAAPSLTSTEIGPLEYLSPASGRLANTVGPVFAGVSYKIVRETSRWNQYRPSSETYVEFPGNAGTQAFTYSGTGTESSLVTFVTADGNRYTQFAGDVTAAARYTRDLRITDQSVVEISAVMAIDASADIADYDRMQIRIGTGAREIAVAFNRVSPDVSVGFVDTSTGLLVDSDSVAASAGEFFLLRVEIDPQRAEARLFIDNQLVQTAALSDFATSTNRTLVVGNFATTGDTVTGQMRFKTFDWYVEDLRSLWNVTEEGATFSASRTLVDATATFVGGDVGKLVRIKNFNDVNPIGGCVRGLWEITAVNSPTEVVVTGSTSRWDNATVRIDRPGEITLRDQPRGFKWPDVLGHSIELLAPHPDAGVYEIVDCLDSVTGESLTARYSPLASQVQDGEFINTEYTNTVRVSGAPTLWTGGGTDAFWRLVPRASGGTDTGPLNYELVDASTNSGPNFTLRQDPSAYGIGAGEVVEVYRSTVLSAQMADPEQRTTYNGTLNDYDQYPFWLASDIGVAADLIPLLTAAGVIPDFESLFVDEAGFHLR